MRSPWWLHAKIIGGYAAIDGELELAPLFQRLHRMGKQLALPVIENRRGAMRFYRYEPGARLIRNRYGIAEPGVTADPIRRLDLLLVPLVAFDDTGNRLGMGGGYYDRFATQHRCRMIGVGHEVQRAETLPAADWDQPLTGVITEATWQAFAPKKSQEKRKLKRK